MKNNSIFHKDEGNFRKKTNERSIYEGQVPAMHKFVNFWADIWEDENETPNKNQRKYEGQHQMYVKIGGSLNKNGI